MEVLIDFQRPFDDLRLNAFIQVVDYMYKGN